MRPTRGTLAPMTPETRYARTTDGGSSAPAIPTRASVIRFDERMT
jgi:hypothetical protein